MQNISRNRIVWVDALNIVACAGVLLLHCTNGQIHGFSGSPSADWYIGLFTHSAFLWPVDVFFMLSGYTLLRSSLLTNVNRGGKTVLQATLAAAGRGRDGMERVLHTVTCGEEHH